MDGACHATPPTAQRSWTELLMRMLATTRNTATLEAQPTVGGPWMQHRDLAGFSIRVPTAWQVQSSGQGEFVIAEPNGAAAALMRKRSVCAGEELVSWLRQSYAATEPGLHNVRMLRAESRDVQVAHAAFDYGGNVFQGRASVVALRRGNLATLFVAAAARADFGLRLPCLAQILCSLRFDVHPGFEFMTDLDLQRLLEIGIDVADPMVLHSQPSHRRRR